MMDQFTLIDALPVPGQEFSIRSGFHDSVVLRSAHKTFQKSRRFVNQFHHFFFLSDATNVALPK